MGWCLDSPCSESTTGSLVWHLSFCSRSQYQCGAILTADVCVDVVHRLSMGRNQDCVPACFLRYRLHYLYRGMIITSIRKLLVVLLTVSPYLTLDHYTTGMANLKVQGPFRPLTVEDRIHSQSIPCEICDEQSGTGTGTGVSPSTTVVPCQHLPPTFHAQSLPVTHAT